MPIPKTRDELTELVTASFAKLRAEHRRRGFTRGTMSQVFVYPPSLHVKEVLEENLETRERRVYIIRNARLDPDWSEVDRQTLTITGRAITSLIHTQGIGDLYRIYATAQRDGADFNLAFIPPTFEVLDMFRGFGRPGRRSRDGFETPAW